MNKVNKVNPLYTTKDHAKMVPGWPQSSFVFGYVKYNLRMNNEIEKKKKNVFSYLLAFTIQPNGKCKKALNNKKLNLSWLQKSEDTQWYTNDK